MRATRRLGQLLAAREKAKGAAQPGVGRKGRAGMMSQQTTPLADLGITRDQSSRYQRLAAVPEPAFEAALAAPGRVTTGGIIAAQSEPTVNAMDDRALWLWGRLKDFEREELFAADPNDLVATMPPHMQATTRDFAPRVAAWLQRIKP
jgi:hypothetical protein